MRAPRTIGGGLVGLVLWLPLLASADMVSGPPPATPMYGAPGPRKLRGADGESWRDVPLPLGLTFWQALRHGRADEIEERAYRVGPPDPEVRAVRRDVRIDVYGALAWVRERTVLSSEEPVRDLRLGMTRSFGGYLGSRMYDLRVRVDGGPVAVEEGRGPFDDTPLAVLASSVGFGTWEWTLDLEREATVELSYLVELQVEGYGDDGRFLDRDDPALAHLGVEVVYDLRLARAFRGGLGETTVTVESHGPMRALAADPSYTRSAEARVFRPGPEARRVMLRLGLPPSAFERFCARPSIEYPTRWLEWLDRAAIARECGRIDPDQAAGLVAQLSLARRAGDVRERRIARVLLEELADAAFQAPESDGPSHADASWGPAWSDPPSPEWTRARRAAAEWLDPDVAERWRARRAAGRDDVHSTKGRFGIEGPEDAPPPPRRAAEQTGFERFTLDASPALARALVAAHGARDPRFDLAAALVLALFAPFGVGYVRWRSRRR